VSEAEVRPAWVTASVFGLVVMATWTLLIKYLAPIVWAVAEHAAGQDAVAPIMWDLWWVAHLALAWLLWHRHPQARNAGLAVAAAEIVIVTVKFVDYARHPDLSFWRLLWLTNKVYVLLFFVWFLCALIRRQA
jgi:hypothetical protein